MTIRELREKKNKLISDARELVGVAVNRGDALTADEKATIAKLRADAASLGELIQAADEADAEARAIVPDTQRLVPASEAGQADESRAKAFRHFLRTGEVREQNLTAANGGYTVAPDTSFYGRVVSALKFFGGVEAAPVTVLTTATGADLPIATDDDTSNMGAIVAEEGSHASGTAITFGQTTLKAYMFSSKIVKVSLQLLQDSSIDIEGFLARKFGERIGRARNYYFTVGVGTSQPQGITVGASTGRTCASGYTTSCTADDLLRLKHSVDIAYRNPATARWMYADTTALVIALLKDGDGQYLLKPGLTEGAPDMLLGYRVIINNDMPAMAASEKSVAFGDFSAYHVRNVAGLTVIRLNELYAANGQVGFLALQRADGALVDAGQHPIKLLVMAAS